jgi:NAD(P)-dependent dehydrogenase (short-subunit alcohol dehydrogenase family)
VTALAGRLAVVTGASRGIGLAVAEALAGTGARVVRLARTLSEGRHGAFVDLPCDLSRASEITAAAGRILAEHGTPAVVVQNAGLWLLAPFETTPLEDLDRLLALNVRAPFLLAQQLVPAMAAARGGLHVAIGSVCDHRAVPGNSAYTASKFGLRGLHESLVAEYRGSGVRCTLISPASTDTTIWDPVDPDTRAGFLRRAQMLRPGDVAEAVLFVATRPPHTEIEWLHLAPSPVSQPK